MWTLLLTFFSYQLFRCPVVSKAVNRTNGYEAAVTNFHLNEYQPTQYRRAEDWMIARWKWIRNNIDSLQKVGAARHGEHPDGDPTTQTTTTRLNLLHDCDYVLHYCMKGYYTGRICGKTIYHIYDTFSSYCELDYVNCMEHYDLWTIAYMGQCVNISSYTNFAYYAYTIWDNEQMEEMYVIPNS